MARAGETRRRRLFGKSLVVAQVAFSVALLSGASLFVRHLSNLEHLNLGFQRDHVLLVELNAASSGYDREHLSRAYLELLRRLQTNPGVRSATMCGFFPMAGVGAMRPATVEGYQAKPGERRFLSEDWVAPKYFETLGIPLLMGRDFSFQDQGRPRVAIVNQTLVRYFDELRGPGGRSAHRVLGQTVRRESDPGPASERIPDRLWRCDDGVDTIRSWRTACPKSRRRANYLSSHVSHLCS
jgi:hypothetical protein